MINKIQATRLYLDYLEEHYNNVQEAWKLVREKCAESGKTFRFMSDGFAYETINADVVWHDESKMSSQEFVQYREKFFPTEKEKELSASDESLKKRVTASFKEAWGNHKKNNTHHWQNWTVNYKNDPYADVYATMMAIDWIAMSMKFGGTARKWYRGEKSKVGDFLPEWAEKHVMDIFECVYGPEND